MGILARAIRQKKKKITIRKSLFADVESHVESSPQKLLGYMNSIQVTGYKIIRKNQLFLHTNNKASEQEIKKAIPFPIIPKQNKYLAIRLTKEEKIQSTNL